MRIENTHLIKESESLRLQAYLPTPNDVPTIGYGHIKNVKLGMTITKDEAEQFLRDDLAWVDKALDSLVKVPLNQSQYDALGSLVFNIGEGQFRNSTLLRKLNEKDYAGAADQFLRWDKQRNKKTGQMEVLKGLTIRRGKERSLFLSPPTKGAPEAVGGSLAGSGAVVATLLAQDATWPVVAIVGAVVGLVLFLAIKQLKKD